ncbi:MAG: aminotransferase class I/II-fold pyridoxal phosphate-dependent enzyme [Steroidobacteraceae bacterium]
MKPESRVNHPPSIELPADNRPVVAPIHQGVKFELESVAETLRVQHGERPGFHYSRLSNPTTRQLEQLLAELQGREDCLVAASGVSVIAQTLIALTKQGDHVLCFIESYGPTRQIVRRLLGRFGVTHTLLSIEDLDGIARALAARPTRLAVFESPTNPVLKIADIAALTRLAREHGALTVLDNTLAGFHQHGEFDVDIYLHSLTKYASGTGDVMGGAAIARSAVIELLRRDFWMFGSYLDAHSAFLILRGLKTYFIRYRAHSASALQVAEYLSAHPAVARVHYPGLRSHPQAALAHTQMRDFGAVVTFDLKGGAEAGRRFAEALELFALAGSLGSTESLVLAPQLLGAGDLSPAELQRSGIAAGTVRLSVGLEDVGDLIEDIGQALGKTAP